MAAKHDKANQGKFNAYAVVYAIVSVGALVLVYMTQRAASVISSSQASVDSSSYFIAHLTSIMLETVLWLIIARAALHLKNYARSISKSADGQALNDIADALLVGLLYAILFGMASTVKTLFWHTAYLSTVTTFTNLLPVGVILIASSLFFMGTQKLNRILPLRTRPLPRKTLFPALATYLVFVAGYTLYFYHVAQRLVDDDTLPHFTLSARVLLPTYVLAYFFVWLLGLLACMNLGRYAGQVTGKIYKMLFRDLYKGIVMIFIGTYLVQIFYVSNLSSNHFGPGLLVIVLLILLLIRGSLLVYRGVSQLDKIERSSPGKV